MRALVFRCLPYKRSKIFKGFILLDSHSLFYSIDFDSSIPPHFPSPYTMSTHATSSPFTLEQQNREFKNSKEPYDVQKQVFLQIIHSPTVFFAARFISIPLVYSIAQKSTTCYKMD